MGQEFSAHPNPPRQNRGPFDSTHSLSVNPAPAGPAVPGGPGGSRDPPPLYPGAPQRARTPPPGSYPMFFSSARQRDRAIGEYLQAHERRTTQIHQPAGAAAAAAAAPPAPAAPAPAAPAPAAPATSMLRENPSDPKYTIGDVEFYGKQPELRRMESLEQAALLSQESESEMKVFALLKVSNGLCLNIIKQTCPVCFDEVEPQRGLHLTQCLHFLCAECFKNYVRSSLHSLATKDSCEITCPQPECKMPLTAAEIRAAAGSKALDFVEHRSLDQAMATNANIRHCPTPDCPYAVEWSGQGNPRMLCNVCKKDSCMLCKASPYHSNMSCQEYKEFKSSPDLTVAAALEKNRNVRQCARCKIFIEKKEGCDKMKCRCGYRFCFKCLTPEATCNCTPAHHGFTDPITGNFDPGVRRY